MTVFSTDRLTIREFVPDDAAFMLELLNSPGWLAYIGDKGIRTEEAAREWIIHAPMKSYADHGYGFWVIERTMDSEPVGITGVIQREYLPMPDVGYALLPRFQGSGYAREAVKATLSYAREVLQMPRLCAIVLPANGASIRLLEALGFSEEDHVTDPVTGEGLVVFACSRDI